MKKLLYFLLSLFICVLLILNLLYREMVFRRDKIVNVKMCSFILICFELFFFLIVDIIYIKLWRNLRDFCLVNL